jgi:hypothetical protein
MRHRLFFSVALALLAARADDVFAADDPPASPPPSDAAAGTPKTAIDIALEDQKARNFARACIALKKAYREDPRPSTLFFLAQCYDQWGQVATAAVLYDDYEAAFDKLPEAEQRAEGDREEIASKRRTELDKRIPKVIVRVPADAPSATRVLRRASEGSPPVPVALGIPLPIDPGEHVLITEIPGRAEGLTKFTIKEGESRTVPVNIPPPSSVEDPTKKPKPIQPVPTLTPTLDPGTSGRRIAAYVFAGVGAAGLLGGVVTGAVTYAQKDPIEKNCLSTNLKMCNPTGVSAKGTAEVSGLVSTVLFPVGAVALGIGALLYFTEPPPSKFGSIAPQFRWNVAAGPGMGGAELEYRW